MKKIITIPAILIVSSIISYSLILEPSAASIAAPVQGSPSLSINSVEVTEGTDSQAVFTVTFEYQGGFREFTTTVNYSTSNGSATAPGDYTQRAGTVTFPEGETPGGRVSMTVSIPIINDEEQEGDETFTVALSNPNFGFILSQPGTCTIHDNDNGPSRMAILDTEIIEGDNGTVDAALRVGLNRRSNTDILVDYTTESISAVAGRDFVERSDTLTIPAGNISRDITIPIIGDILPECPQRFFVRLSNARGAEITDDEGVCTIIDNDDPEVITVCSTDVPKEGVEFTSSLTVDRDIIADNVSVRLHISHANISTFTAKVNLGLQKDSSSDARLFPGGLSIPANSSIGTTCSPIPDFAITDNAAQRIQDHDGEAPYIGSWLSTGRRSLVTSDIEGTNARGTYSLEKIQFNTIGDSITVRLNCWCLVITAPCEGLKLEPARATLPVFDNISFDLDEEDNRLGQPYGGHYVKAALNTAAGPAANVPVTFTVRDRGGEGDILSTQVINTDERGRALLHYLDWVPGEQTIEARAEIDGAIYTDIARVTFLNPCAATQAVQSVSNAETTLNSMREFRDSKLAKSKRGQKYARSYYKVSSEAVRTMMLNPMMVIRSQQMIQRYMPVVRDMAAGKNISLTQGDLAEIDGFLNDFASKGSNELKQTVKGLCEDLRNPQVHREFGITVTPGPRRDMPAQNQLMSFKQVGAVTTSLGLFLALGYCMTGNRRRKSIRHARTLLCVMLALSVVNVGVRGQGSGVRGQSKVFKSKVEGPGPSTLNLRTLDPQQAGLSKALNKLPLRFEANHGQTHSQARFISRGAGYNLFLSPNEAEFVTPRRGVAGSRELDDETIAASNSTLRMKLVGSNLDSHISGLDELPTKTNYFIGKDRSRWRSDVPSYSKIKYEYVYDGVDMVYYGNDGRLEYDFIVAPGADPDSIKIAFEGADNVGIDFNGDLVLSAAGGEVRHCKPVIYQEVNGVKHTVPGRYTLREGKRQKAKVKTEQHVTHHASLVTFEIGEYDPSLPLVIDPVIDYSTYLGGNGDDQGTSMFVDSAGNVYIVGITDSANLPTLNPAQPDFGGGSQDTFVAKLDPSGTRLIYLTYLGGTEFDNATGLAVDSAGNAYVTGFTRSTNFPSLSAFQPNNRGQFNSFVSKLGPTGNLVYSTYLGGTTNDAGSGIAVDSAGNAYIAGIATSANFPTVNALQPNFGGASDLYVAKLNPAGNQLIYSTFVGGSREDAATSITVDQSGNVYVTGATLSSDFRTANAAQANHGGGIFDAFVMKLNAAGNSLIYSTYMGGGGADRGLRIAADSSGNAYVTGDTFSTNFPTANALQRNLNGDSDAFVAKLNVNGTIAYSTYLGGSETDGGTAISVDSTGRAYITGFTGSSDFPLVAALQQVYGGGEFDAFIAKLIASGSALELSTYLGGNGMDSGFGIASGNAESVYVMGLTDSTNFPIMNSLQANHAGGASDLFITRIRPGPVITGVTIKKAKHLIISGSEFERGAVILIDGEEQKTKFKSATSLKGKKVALRIAPGAMVRLQVRNPDGATSAEFNYTRAN